MTTQRRCITHWKKIRCATSKPWWRSWTKTTTCLRSLNPRCNNLKQLLGQPEPILSRVPGQRYRQRLPRYWARTSVALSPMQRLLSRVERLVLEEYNHLCRRPNRLTCAQKLIALRLVNPTRNSTLLSSAAPQTINHSTMLLCILHMQLLWALPTSRKVDSQQLHKLSCSLKTAWNAFLVRDSRRTHRSLLIRWFKRQTFYSGQCSVQSEVTVRSKNLSHIRCHCSGSMS